MKKLSLLLVFFLSGSAYCKEIPSPFWYNLSEKIMVGTSQFISPELNTVKTQTVKMKQKEVILDTPLRCLPKKETIVITPFVTINSNGMWIETEKI